MIMLLELIKALFVGMVVAAPVGPVLLLVIHKTLCHGRKAGLLAGIGSMIADNVYAAAGILFLSAVRGFIDSHLGIIMTAGGVLVCVVGVFMFRRKQIDEKVDSKGHGGCSYVFQTMACAFSNPSAFAFMLAMLAMCRIDIGNLSSPVWLMLVFIAAGEFLYWMFITFALERFWKVSDAALLRICRIGAVIMWIFGVILLVKGLKILF